MYSEYLNNFKAIIAQAESFESMADERPTATLEYCYFVFDSTKEKIYTGLDALFDDNTITNGERVNFLILNGYATASVDYSQYNSSEEKFIKFYDYFYCRGELYSMTSKAVKGDYLLSFKEYVYKCLQICREYEEMYQVFKKTYIPPIIPEGDTTSKPVTALEAFWDNNYLTFKKLIEENINIFLEVGDNFSSIQQIVIRLKDLFYNLSYKTSLCETFINADGVESTEDKTILSDSFSDIGVLGFNLFNTDIGSAYQCYLDAIEARNKNSLYASDMYNTNLRNFVRDNVAKSIDFYTQSTEILTNIKSLKAKYSL